MEGFAFRKVMVRPVRLLGLGPLEWLIVLVSAALVYAIARLPERRR